MASSPLDQATAPSLGSGASFAVLGGQTVTNTGSTLVNGDLGVSPGTAVTGFPPGIVVGGTIHANDAVAVQAQSDVTTAYNILAGQVCNTNLTGQDLGGRTLVAGVYCFSSSAQLTGTLTLDAQGNPNAVFIFQIGSTLTTASNSSVRVINGGNCGNVFFQVGSSATLGTDTAFTGNILALVSITLTTGASVSGRVLARTGAVTLDTNNVSTACTAVPLTSTAIAATATALPLTATALPLTATAQALTATPLPLTATAVAATQTAIPATLTAIPGTLTALPLTATAIALRTPPPIVLPPPPLIPPLIPPPLIPPLPLIPPSSGVGARQQCCPPPGMQAAPSAPEGVPVIPEAGSLLLVGGALAVIGGWMGLRRWRSRGE